MISTPTDKQTPAKVLLIDDERPICIAVSDLLETYGYEIQYGHSAQEGLKLLGRNPFTDIILLDYSLQGDLSGLETIPKLKEKSPHAQIIMLTSHDRLDVGVECIKAGAFDFLTKPFDENRFFKIVPRALEKKKLSQMSQLYLSILVHDMHSPVANLKMGWDFFRETAQSLSLSDKHRQILSGMEVGIWEIRNIIQNIISVSKFEEGHAAANHTTFSLSEEVNAVGKIFQSYMLLAGKGLEVTSNLEPEETLTTDREFFKQVLLNLVNNSLRYCPEGQSVKVTVAKEQGKIQIGVMNPGSYIEPELRQQVFEKYFRGSLGHSYEGNKNFGLGLTYCRLAVEAMGGSIWVDSHQDPAWTCFRFTVKNHKPS